MASANHHSDWNVRWTTDEERPAAQDVVHRTWQAAYAGIFTPEEIEAVFDGQTPMQTSWIGGRTDRIGSLGAWDGGTLVGVAGLAMRAQEGDGELAAIYVLPEHQGRGIGHALWDASITTLRERGCAGMQVWVLAANLPAVRFYERHGCARFAQGTFTLGDHQEPAIGLRLEL